MEHHGLMEERMLAHHAAAHHHAHHHHSHMHSNMNLKDRVLTLLKMVHPDKVMRSGSQGSLASSKDPQAMNTDEEDWPGRGVSRGQSSQGSVTNIAKLWHRGSKIFKNSLQNALDQFPTTAKNQKNSQPGAKEISQGPSKSGELFHPLRAVIGQCALSSSDDSLNAETEAKERLPDLNSVSWFQVGTGTAEARQRKLEEIYSWHLEGAEDEAGGAEKREMVGDHEVEERAERTSANLFPYLHALVVVLLASCDLLAAIILQLFWGEDDFLCLEADEGAEGPGYAVNQTAANLLWFISFWHFSDWICILVQCYFSGHGLSRALVHASSASQVAVDLGVILSCFSFFQLNLWLCEGGGLEGWGYFYFFVVRLHYLLFFFRGVNGVYRCMRLEMEVTKNIRIAVSQNKRRFVSPALDVDLDLSYICDRLIAMSLPCVSGVRYRNNMQDVSKFFRTRHYGCFKVYNLCEEFESHGNGNYDCALLYDQVQKYPFHDHNAPRFEQLLNYCEDATAWLNMSSQHVVSVHCQGGKGRTGTFVSSLLLWSGFCKTANEALLAFACRRTDTRRGLAPIQGVTSPSQIRYVNYLQKFLANTDFISARHFFLSKMSFSNVPKEMSKHKLVFVVECCGQILFDQGKQKGFFTIPQQDCEEDGSFSLTFKHEIFVYKDVAIRFFSFGGGEEVTVQDQVALKQLGGLGEGARTIRYGNLVGKQLMFVQFHTAALDSPHLCFQKQQIDGIYSKRGPEFNKFQLKLDFSPSREEAMSPENRNSTAMVPAFRFSMVREEVGQLLQRLQPRTETFSRGEIVCAENEDSGGRRVLKYIVSGACKRYQAGLDANQSIINNGKSLHGEFRGAGDFVGLLPFVYGAGANKSTTVFRAWTDVVEVRSVYLAESQSDLVSELLFCGCTEQESAWLWEDIAISILNVRRNLAMTWLLKQNLTNKKTAGSEFRSTTERAMKLSKEVKSQFDLPPQEQLLQSGECVRLVTPDNGQSQHQTATGQVLLFENWLVFRESTAGKLSAFDFKIPLESLESLKHSGRMISLETKASSECGTAEGSGSPDTGEGPGGSAANLVGPIQGVGSPERAQSPDNALSRSGSFRARRANQRRKLGRISPPWRETRASSAVEQGANRADFLRAVSGPASPTNRNFFLRRSELSGSSQKSYQNMELWGSFGRSDLTPAPGTVHLKLKSVGVSSSMASVVEMRLADIREEIRSSLRTKVFTPNGRIRSSYSDYGYVLPGEAKMAGEEDFMALLHTASTTRTFYAGDVIINEGATDRNIMHIETGLVNCINHRSGDLITSFGPGEILGEISFLHLGVLGAACDCVAASDCEVRVLSRECLQLLIRQPLFAARFFRGLSIVSCTRLVTSTKALQHQTMVHNLLERGENT